MFGLFKSTQTTATEAAIDAIRPIIGIVQHSYGLPQGFWTDPYVLGFLSITIAHHAKLATGGKARGEIMGYVLSDVLTSLSNMNGRELGRRITALATATERDADYNRGGDDAAAVCYCAQGILKNEADHPLVQAASRLADGADFGDLSRIDRRSKIAGMMVVLSLVKEVEERIAIS
jgi:hypothetical protein